MGTQNGRCAGTPASTTTFRCGPALGAVRNIGETLKILMNKSATQQGVDGGKKQVQRPHVDVQQGTATAQKADEVLSTKRPPEDSASGCRYQYRMAFEIPTAVKDYHCRKKNYTCEDKLLPMLAGMAVQCLNRNRPSPR